MLCFLVLKLQKGFVYVCSCNQANPHNTIQTTAYVSPATIHLAFLG